MKQAFLSVERWTTGVSMVVACLMLVIASGRGMFPIITRFILEQPAEGSDILIRLSLIWRVFMGIPAALRQGAMVSVDVLYRWSQRFTSCNPCPLTSLIRADRRVRIKPSGECFHPWKPPKAHATPSLVR